MGMSLQRFTFELNHSYTFQRQLVEDTEHGKLDHIAFHFRPIPIILVSSVFLHLNYLYPFSFFNLWSHAPTHHDVSE
ncbi:hypothetical protein VNO77_44595 [Canavalia gladiata]|uniref:Uncharacterized protein n=1 Tax=Canavalia gladiata TaxID=3824 RepID=A0AAN9JYH9_CANGL